MIACNDDGTQCPTLLPFSFQAWVQAHQRVADCYFNWQCIRYIVSLIGKQSRRVGYTLSITEFNGVPSR